MSETLLSGLAASFSGLGHSGYGHNSGYGHSGYGHSGSGYGSDHKDHYGGHSGHGHSGGGYHDDKCCPLVVDALCLAAILGAIAGAALLLARVIQIEIMPGRRKRSLTFKSFVVEGKHSTTSMNYVASKPAVQCRN